MPRIETAGCSLHYIKAGQGPAVLMLQGVGPIGEAWRPQIDALSNAFTTIAPDNRGVGQSRRLDARLSIEAMADDAIAIMDAEGIDRFHIVGHSMGGAIAQAVALRATPRVLTLSLLCTFLRGTQALSLSPGLIWSGLRTRIGSQAMRRDAFLELVFSRGYLAAADKAETAALLGRLFGHKINQQPPIVFTQLRALMRFDARDRLASLGAIPTLVASAKEDRIARPAFGRALAAAIPGARFVELMDVSHGAPIESPAKVNDLLREHFARALA